MTDPDNEGSDPGFDPRLDPAPQSPELIMLEERVSAALSAVTDLGGLQAKTIAARLAAEARAKAWSDIAYEMWALVVNSVHDGHGNAEAPALWEAQKNALRERLHAALDQMPEDV